MKKNVIFLVLFLFFFSIFAAVHMLIVSFMINNKFPVIAWFSCGATSAIATMLALREYSNVIIYRIATGSEHPDNERFLHDCEEKLFHQSIVTVRSEKYSNVFDVLSSKRFINSPYGASCTYELKKQVRFKIEDDLRFWDGQVFGFDTSERKRAQRFLEQYPYSKPFFPLIDHNLSKEDCLSIIAYHSIQLPAMYQLGYNNNNCLGCVKGGKGYWNMIRKDFPDVFLKMSLLERQIGHSCINGCFLDELPVDVGRRQGLMPECSIFCALDFMDI